MKISALKVRNFRGIEAAEIENARETIIIAGQNGSGKSCILDAIRLIKSVYGGYHQNEWQNWFGEFQINPNSKGDELKGFFNDSSKRVELDCSFSFSESERSFIINNIDELLRDAIWRTLLPEAFQWGGYRMAMFASQFREREAEVANLVESQKPEILSELSQSVATAKVFMEPGGQLKLATSRLLTTVFTNFRPNDLGVIDYHGAQRHYNREVLQGINLNLDGINQSQIQSALYNYSAKYANVKSEMAAEFIREILADRAGNSDLKKTGLSDTLKELFTIFFPGKQFLGPTPTSNGGLEFPVRIANGSIHDIDELSSGEKEILYGYLRIRKSAPCNSIILLDEPELHLNPRLVRNLPEFYRKHLGEKLNNQIWLITHSDALLREAVGKPRFTVYHMFPCGTDNGLGQLRELGATEDLDLALADLVGDLAAYKPNGSAIVFEGGGDSDIDRGIVSKLFANEVASFNLISGSNKTKLSALHDILNTAYSKGHLGMKFYAVCDRDSEKDTLSTALRRYRWDVYHIENYLLDERIISLVVNSLTGLAYTGEEILNKMEVAARTVSPKLLHHRLRSHLNALIVEQIDIGFNPKASDLAVVASEALSRSVERVIQSSSEINETAIREKLNQWTQEQEHWFTENSWRKNIPGREILKELQSILQINVPYDSFRNLILSRMVEENHKPNGMKIVIDAILSDNAVVN